MNIQKGGEKNFLDYIGKYPTVNKDLITALNKEQELVDYLDKEAPVIIICMGLSICYEYKFKVSGKRKKYEECYEKEAEFVKKELIGSFAKCRREHDFPRKKHYFNYLYIQKSIQNN